MENDKETISMSWREVSLDVDSLMELAIDKDSISYTRSITNGQYTISIQSDFINDSLNPDYVYSDRLIWPIIQNQKLIIEKKGDVKFEYLIPLKKKMRPNNLSINIQSLETPIWEIAIYNGSQIIIGVHGEDYCLGSRCAKFIGLYDLQGKVLFEQYLDSVTFSENTDLVLALEKNGINDSIWSAGVEMSIR